MPMTWSSMASCSSLTAEIHTTTLTVLLARGITRKVTLHDGNTGKTRTIIDIEKAAPWCVGSNLERYPVEGTSGIRQQPVHSRRAYGCCHHTRSSRRGCLSMRDKLRFERNY